MTHIWVPRTKIIEIEPPPQAVCLQGRFKLIKRDRWEKPIQETPWFSNLILNSGLNRMGTGSAIAGAMIGTGTSAPAATQTSLDNQAAFANSSGAGSSFSTVSGSPYNNISTFVYRTALGALNGNFTEVGVGWASGSCFARELIRDGLGNPTTISVLSTEQLDIFYQLSVFPPLVDTSGTITITGVGSRGFTGRAASAGTSSWNAGILTSSAVQFNTILPAVLYTGAIGAITDTPSGTSFSATSGTNATYANNSYRREVTLTWATSTANNGALRSAQVFFGSGGGSGAAFQYEFGSTFAKTNLQTLALNFAINWARRP